MPHLAFDLNFAPSPESRRALAAAVVRRFSEIMETGTDHVGVIVRCHAKDDLAFGRAGPDGRVVFVNADIRAGRTKEQKRRLALAFLDEAHRNFDVPKRAIYVVYTEHDGEHFQLEEKVLPGWTAGEDPLAPT